MATQSSNKGRTKPYKTRNWVSIVYPESAPENWMDILNDSHIPAIVSPLHDKDINPGTKEPKKAHYHVMLMYEGPKEEHIARKIFESIAGVGCEPVNSVRGQARYFCHLDNPEKAQYSASGIKAFSGANYDNLIALPSDKYKIIGEMIDWVEENDIRSFRDLMVYSRQQKTDWFQCLCDSGTYVMKEYVKSRTWQLEREGGGFDGEASGSRGHS